MREFIQLYRQDINPADCAKNSLTVARGPGVQGSFGCTGRLSLVHWGGKMVKGRTWLLVALQFAPREQESRQRREDSWVVGRDSLFWGLSQFTQQESHAPFLHLQMVTQSKHNPHSGQLSFSTFPWLPLFWFSLFKRKIYPSSK